MNLLLIFIIFNFITIEIVNGEITQKPCIPRNYGHGSVVCLCNATYCDNLDWTDDIPGPGQFLQVSSSEDGERFFYQLRNFTDSDNNKNFRKEFVLNINRDQTYQKIIGFGGAFTDAAGINLASLSKELQDCLIESYFSRDGLNYNIGRVPMAGTDFSTHTYSYADVSNDTGLFHFRLTEEDLVYKIPYIHQAKNIQPALKLLACPWSAPKWMKTNDNFSGLGFLKKDLYQTWADYFVRFLEEYKKHNLTLWGITAQNEPIDGLIPFFPFNCMGWTASQQRDWIKNNLGPTLNRSGFGNVKLLIFEDQRPFLVSWVRTVMRDPEAAKYVHGVGLHWYMNFYPASSLDTINKEYPDLFLLGTEACAGTGIEEPVRLGAWIRAERYAEDIINGINHWYTGWIDWNLFLDLGGGPNWSKNFVDAPIIVDSTIDTAYKQPMFYAMGHFSKFIPENSVRVKSELEGLALGFKVLTILRPDGKIVIVVLNKSATLHSLKIMDSKVNRTLTVEVKGNSMSTILY